VLNIFGQSCIFKSDLRPWSCEPLTAASSVARTISGSLRSTRFITRFFVRICLAKNSPSL